MSLYPSAPRREKEKYPREGGGVEPCRDRKSVPDQALVHDVTLVAKDPIMSLTLSFMGAWHRRAMNLQNST
jgi:hypothetical protein